MADTSEGNLATEEGGGVWRFPENQPLRLDSGAVLPNLEVAYKTYGRLNSKKSNAILVCHALTLDQYVASDNPTTGRPAWWKEAVGPGQPIDPAKHFIICANVVGGCMGT